LRRILIIGTALAVLGTTTALAAGDFNSYTATATFSPSKAGSVKSPSAFAMRELWTAKGLNGHQAGPLTKIVSKIYGVVSHGKSFPVCTDATINNGGKTGKWDKACPKGSLVAEGPVNSFLVGSSQPTSQGSPCNPYLHVYNGGQGKLVFFFVTGPFSPNPAKYECAGTTTGTSAPPYDATVKQQGPNEITTIPLPAYVSTRAGNIPGAYADLVRLDVTFKKLTKKVHGKTVPYQASVACKSGKRPYSFTFTATNYPGNSPSTQTTTISHSAKC
jgi:hypothetical protein